MTISCETAELDTDRLPADGLIDEAVDLLKGFADYTRFKILLLRHDEVCVHHVTALDYYLRSWRISQACRNTLGEKFALNNVGYMHYRLGQYQEL